MDHGAQNSKRIHSDRENHTNRNNNSRTDLGGRDFPRTNHARNLPIQEIENDNNDIELSPSPSGYLTPTPRSFILPLLEVLRHPKVRGELQNAILEKIDAQEKELEAAASQRNPNQLEVMKYSGGGKEDSKSKLMSGGESSIYDKIKKDELNPMAQMDKPKRRRRSRSRPGTFVHGTFKSISKLNASEVVDRVNSYLPIGIYFASVHNLAENLQQLLALLKSESSAMAEADSANLLDHEAFLLLLIRQLIQNEELGAFKLVLASLKNLNVMINKEMFDIFEESTKFKYLEEFFTQYNKSLSKNSSASKLKTMISRRSEEPLDARQKSDRFTLSQDKLVLMIQKYMLCSDKNHTIVEIFSKLGIDNKTKVELFLNSKEETRFIDIINENEELLKYIDYKELVDRRLFKMLILYDRAKLIDVFNYTLKDINGEETVTVYDKLCELIGNSIDVEALSNVVTHVHSTFWDMEKLPKFHKALSMVLDDSEKEQYQAEEGTVVGSTKKTWLVHIQNPLLFCIKLVFFFKKMKEQLDFKNKEILELKDSLLAFCISYAQNASEEVLMVNLFEKDARDRDFMEYAFMVQEMSLIQIEFIEGLIYQMWDLGRHTMQTITQFMRINFMKDDIHKFTWSVFTRKYEMPIEENDAFQMEFRFTSNSVFLRVLSELFWPATLIIIEFIFNLKIIEMYKGFTFNQNWLSTYFDNNRVFAWVHLYLRVNYIISNLLKSVLLRMFQREGFYHQYFYNTLNILYVLQMVIDPLLLWDTFWFMNNVQMLIVLTMIGYIFYNGLALKSIGIVLRIFMRMVYVVLIFGIVSCFIMLLIAYPIHTIYIDFSQVVDGQIFPQMNMFRSLYNGVLTLFEFVFGAVIFVRPYLEQNLYTYSISFIMIIFSFFGNIMMANMLVAFLARQLQEITEKAKYYTNRMQFGLVKIFNMRDLDAIFVMPYFLAGPLLPVYLFMIKAGPMRKAVNQFLRKIIHIFNVFLPTLISMNIFLVILFVIRYIEFLLFTLIRAPVQPMYIVYFFAWAVGGPFLLLKLYVQDVCTMCGVMLNLSTKSDDLLDTTLNESAKENLINIFGKIKAKAQEHLHNNPEQSKLTINQFLSMLELHNIALTILGRAIKDDDKAQKDGKEEDTESEEDEALFGFAAKFNANYNKDENKLIVDLLKKFAIQQGKSDDVLDMELDLELMLQKFKGNINSDNISKLVGFDMTTLYKANRLINSSSKSDVKTELIKVKEKIGTMESQIDVILTEIEDLKKLIFK